MQCDEAISFVFAMLTLEMICALLQGLPADHLDHLDRPWYLLAVRIERALKEGLDPTSALHAALSNSAEWERQVFLRAFLQEEPVLALPDLTQRQKEALIALRYAGVCSLSQLSRILAQDKGNTSRRLDVLIEKRYAVKYFRRDGPYYLAISSPLDDQTKSKVTGLMQAFKQALIASQDSPLPPSEAREKGSWVNGVTSPTTTTTPTTSTTPTKATASTTATTSSTQSVDVPCPAQPGRNSNATGAFPVANHLPRPP